MKNLLEEIKRLRELAGKPAGTMDHWWEFKQKALVACDALEKAIAETKRQISDCCLSCLDGDCGADWEMGLKPCPYCTPARALLKEWGIE